MATQNVNLTPELERFVKQAVKSGAYNSASDVHRAALQAMAHKQEQRELRVARLRQEIQAGLDSGLPGKVRDLGAFMEKCAKQAHGSRTKGGR